MDNVAAFFNTPGTFPPSFGGDRLAYAASVFGLLGSALLALEWLHRTIWRLVDDREALSHPLTIVRVVLALLLFATLCRISPDVALVMFWPEIDPAQRLLIARADRLLDGLSIIPFGIAWAFGLFSAPVVEYQLIRKPIPGDLWPTWERVRRPLSMGAMILVIALTLAFLR